MSAATLPEPRTYKARLNVLVSVEISTEAESTEPLPDLDEDELSRAVARALQPSPFGDVMLGNVGWEWCSSLNVVEEAVADSALHGWETDEETTARIAQERADVEQFISRDHHARGGTV